MNRAYDDWSALAAILLLLWWVAYQFSRRTYRLTVGVVATAGVLAVTGYGLRLSGRHPTFASGLLAGGNAIGRDMLGSFIPAGLRQTLLLGPMGWLLLLLIGSLLVTFDTLSTRRQQPTVNVGTVPPSGGGGDGSTSGGDSSGDGNPSGGRRAALSRQVITEELKFRLPAVAVRSPASMPGGSTPPGCSGAR